jgi:exosome complex RNA-binding protein Rrp42 (RNase PH superfamily)
MAQPQKQPAAAAALPPPAPLAALQEWLDLPTTSDTSISLIHALDPQQVEDFWKQSTRPDGRLFAQCRPTKVVSGMLKHSAGSALVTQSGDDHHSTKVLAATTLQIGQPSPEQPQDGEVVVQVSGTGGKNLGQDFARNQQHWDVLQAWLQRMLREGDIPSRLNLLTGKACLRLVVSVLVLEDGGNLMDASLLACEAAWKDTRLPKVGQDLVESQGKLWWKDEIAFSSVTTDEKKCTDDDISPRDFRISLTMGVYQSSDKTNLLVDPSSQEEPFLEGALTITVGMRSGKLQVEYAGKPALSATDLALAAKLAKARAAELSNILSA